MDFDMVKAAYDEYAKTIFSTALQITQSTAEADDILQDVFLKAIKTVKKGESIQNMKSWLYRTTVNTAIDHMKKKRPLSLEQTSYIESSLFTNNNENSELFDAIRELPEDERIAVILFDIEGFAHKEIAEIRGCSEDKIKMDLHRGRKRLAKLLNHLKIY